MKNLMECSLNDGFLPSFDSSSSEDENEDWLISYSLFGNIMDSNIEIGKERALK